MPGDMVMNVDGTAGYKCECSTGAKTWLAHWERAHGGPLPDTCRASKCRNPVQVGAHVTVIDGDKRIMWIVPFCQKHNKRPSHVIIELKDQTALYSAARSYCAEM